MARGGDLAKARDRCGIDRPHPEPSPNPLTKDVCQRDRQAYWEAIKDRLGQGRFDSGPRDRLQRKSAPRRGFLGGGGTTGKSKADRSELLVRGRILIGHSGRSDLGRLPAFRTEDFEGRALTDEDVRQMAPVLILLLRGFG